MVEIVVGHTEIFNTPADHHVRCRVDGLFDQSGRMLSKTDEHILIRR